VGRASGEPHKHFEDGGARPRLDPPYVTQPSGIVVNCILNWRRVRVISINDKKLGWHVPLIFFFLLADGIWLTLSSGYFPEGVLMLSFSILYLGRIILKIIDRPNAAYYFWAMYGILLAIYIWVAKF
jgi:hypothetical protein